MVIFNRSPALVGRVFRSSVPLISPLRYSPTAIAITTPALRFAITKAFEPINKSSCEFAHPPDSKLRGNLLICCRSKVLR